MLNRNGFLDVFVGNLYYLFDSTFFDAIFFKDSPLDSVGTYGTTVADLNNDGYVVMWGNEMGYSPFNKHEFLSLRDCRNVQAYDINGDGWVDVIFGEKAPLFDWRNGRITTSTNYGILVMDFDGDGKHILEHWASSIL